MAHAFVNIIVPFRSELADAVDARLRQLSLADAEEGPPGKRKPAEGNRPRPEVEARLDAIGTIHFLTLAAVRPGSPAQGYPQPVDAARPAHLVIEISADGGGAEVIRRLADELASELGDVLADAGVKPDEPLVAFLLRHRRDIGDTWGSDALGQIFTGSPGMTVWRIDQEERLAGRIGALIDRLRTTAQWPGRSPRARLDMIRDIVWDEGGYKWAFVPEPAPCLAGDPHNQWDSKLSPANLQYWKAGLTILHKLFWPLELLLLAGVLLSLPRLASLWQEQGAVATATWFITVAIVVVIALAAAGGLTYFRLRRLEETDPVEDVVPPARQAADLMAVENFAAQNHLASISVLKSGWLRRLTLRLAFIVVGTGRFVGPPGFLGKNGVIHFARWMRLPGTEQLLFWSNYDGTWESYVGDFIADAPSGVTAIWSNCIGFPRSRGLFGKGATNRDRLVNWARRQQYPTLFFYSAYRQLTAGRIRINAAIRQGFASAQSDADARDWLALFGSAPMPADVLQIAQIPTLVFGGLPRLRHSTAFILTLRDGIGPERCREWLAVVAQRAAYGEMTPGQRSAVVIALSAEGMRRLGVPPDALATFPVAFQQGMSQPSRARALGDTGDSAPRSWTWGNDTCRAHFLLTIYGLDRKDVEEAATELLPAEEIAQRLPLELAVLPERPRREASGSARPQEVAAAERADSGTAGNETGAATASTRNGGACPHLGASAAEHPRYEPRAHGGRGPFPPEPFGFADGVSQPIIRGTPGWNKRAAGMHARDSDELLPGAGGKERTRSTASDLVEPGEIILGYPDNIGTIPPAPSIDARFDPHHLLPDAGTDPLRRRPEMSRYEGTGRRDLGGHGTYLVARQLQQNVNEFKCWLDATADRLREEAYVAVQGSRVAILFGPRAQDLAAGPLARPRRDVAGESGGAGKRADEQAGLPDGPIERERIKEAIAAKLVGRWKDGTSLVRYPQMPGRDQDPPAGPDNEFLFGVEDPAGLHCPLGAHIRRANPRDARFRGEDQELATTNRHRILRVGRAYGRLFTEDPEQGLLFMCLNADISRQFEFIQRTWLLNPNLHNLENEVDPFLGRGRRIFTLPTATGPIRLPGPKEDLVTVKGGEYFFLPGRAALNYLASQPLQG